jgi:hypothetical protein
MDNVFDFLPETFKDGPIRLSGFGQDDQSLGPRIGIGMAKDRNTPSTYTGDVADPLFDLLGIDVVPGPDDDVLCPPRQINLVLCPLHRLKQVTRVFGCGKKLGRKLHTKGPLEAHSRRFSVS